MGFFSWLFGLKKDKKAAVKQSTNNFSFDVYKRSGYNLDEYTPDTPPESQGFESVHISRSPISYNSKINHPDSFDFEDEHEKEIERWRNKIDNAEVRSGDYENPDKQVAAFERWIAIYEDCRYFCESHTGGDYYWLDWFDDSYERAKKDLQDYIDNEYESVKAEWDETQRKKRFYSSAKKKIHKVITNSETGMSRKDVYALFSPDEQSVILKALNELVSEGKIKQEKHGSIIKCFSL